MFAEFDYKLFPIVIVKFNKDIDNEEDFNNFLIRWLQLYKNCKEFIFLFDTTDVGVPPIKYCFRMSSFIKNLRKQKIQYLKKSIIIVKNKKVLRLLNIIFYLQPPVAPVYLTMDNIDSILNNIKENTTNKISVIKYIKANKPYLPFL